MTGWVGKIRPGGFVAGKTNPPDRDSNTFEPLGLFGCSTGEERYWSKVESET
jgi:hypothetical protein